MESCESGEEIVRVAEIAKMTGKPIDTIRWYRHRQTAGHDEGPRMFKLGRNVVAKRADVAAWIESHHGPEVFVPSTSGRRVVDVDGLRAMVEESIKAIVVTAETGECDHRDDWRDAALAEKIAQAIEGEAQFEGPRAQRVIAMCAGVARRFGGGPHSYTAFGEVIRADLDGIDGQRRTKP